jgi:hypothetical protein
MLTLRELDATADAADACARAATALKRATRDVEASARGFGLAPNAVARARELCVEVTRLASRVDAAIVAAEDAAALDASAATRDSFLTRAEDRAATRERLASAPAEPVRIHLVRYQKGKEASAPSVPFLFHRRRAGSRDADDAFDAFAKRSAREMRAVLVGAREKLNVPIAVSGLYSARTGEKVYGVDGFRRGETYLAKTASDVDSESTLRNAVISRLTSSNAKREVSLTSRASSAEAGVPPGRPSAAAAAAARRLRAARDSELAEPKPAWNRSFEVKIRAYGVPEATAFTEARRSRTGETATTSGCAPPPPPGKKKKKPLGDCSRRDSPRKV